MPTKKSKAAVKADWPANPQLDAPVYLDALNGRDGKIWRPALDEHGGLRVEIDVWAAPFFGDNLYVWVSPVGIPVWTLLWQEHFPNPVTTPTLEILIPMTVLSHGLYQLRYAVRNGTVGDYTDFSEEAQADIDLWGPYLGPGSSIRPPIAGFPSAIPSTATIITQTLIDLTPVFEFSIPPDPRWESGAMIRYWWTRENPANNEDPIDTVPFPKPGRSIEIPNTFFRKPEMCWTVSFFLSIS